MKLGIFDHMQKNDKPERSYADLYAGTRPIDQSIGQPRAQDAVLPQEGLEVHGLAGGPDAADQHVEVGTVFVHLGSVAAHRGSQGQAGQGGLRLADTPRRPPAAG